jgi:hypothetical protein
MKNITTTLLKNSIEGLLSKNEKFFKQNLTQALAIKLHESFLQVKNNVSKKLLYTEETTPDSIELKEFIDFTKNFNPGIHKFKNGFSINISESDVVLLKKLFESLSPENRQKMVSEILTNEEALKQHLTFSQKVKNLI